MIICDKNDSISVRIVRVNYWRACLERTFFFRGAGGLSVNCHVILFWQPLLRYVPFSNFYFYYILWCRVVTIPAFHTEDAISDYSPVLNDIFLLMFTALPFVLFLLWLFMLLFVPITFVPVPFFPYIKSCQCLLCLWSIRICSACEPRRA